MCRGGTKRPKRLNRLGIGRAVISPADQPVGPRMIAHQFRCPKWIARIHCIRRVETVVQAGIKPKNQIALRTHC